MDCFVKLWTEMFREVQLSPIIIFSLPFMAKVNSLHVFVDSYFLLTLFLSSGSSDSESSFLSLGTSVLNVWNSFVISARNSLNFYYETVFFDASVSLLCHKCATSGKSTLEIYTIILPKFLKPFGIRRKLLTINYFIWYVISSQNLFC